MQPITRFRSKEGSLHGSLESKTTIWPPVMIPFLIPKFCKAATSPIKTLLFSSPIFSFRNDSGLDHSRVPKKRSAPLSVFLLVTQHTFSLLFLLFFLLARPAVPPSHVKVPKTTVASCQFGARSLISYPPLSSSTLPTSMSTVKPRAAPAAAPADPNHRSCVGGQTIATCPSCAGAPHGGRSATPVLPRKSSQLP